MHHLGTGVAVMFLDLDGFKSVNDSLGHLVGDQLLIAFGQRLKSCVHGDTVARLGGDKFTILMDDTRATLTKLLELRALGVRVAIDDFGSGYASLTSLRRLPVRSLKLDPSFMGPRRRSVHIVRAVATLAHALGLEISAEGIETDEQLSGSARPTWTGARATCSRGRSPRTRWAASSRRGAC